MLNLSFNYVGTKVRVNFRGDCLKQEKVSFDHGKIINIYFVYEIDDYSNISSYPTLENCLFSAVKLTNMLILICKNIPNIVSDSIEKDFIHLVMKLINVIIFGVDMSLSSHMDNKKKIF